MRRVTLLATAAILLPVALAGQQPGPDQSLGDLDITQLARIRVTSVSRRPEPISEAAAAVFVITRNDIERSGAASLPEALRLAPGLEVARVGSREWAISARGFNEVTSNKLLVLIDGRAVYSPLFAGVFWDVQDVVLQDIDRIEVILGPGATLWGSNAVNGVINIITRPAAETTGGLALAHVGTEDRVGGTLQYGGALGRAVDARAYARYLYQDPADLTTGDAAHDEWRMGQGGFRLDARISPRDNLTFEGDVYVARGSERQQLPTPDPPFGALSVYDVRTHGGNLLGRWSRRLSGTSELSARAYVDRTVRDQAPYFGRAALTTADAEVQHRFTLGGRHEIVWGLGARLNADDISGAYPVSFQPSSRTTHLVTGFLQDDIALGANGWHVTLGSKLEHNSFSGLELQPNVRLLWQLTPRHTLWSAVSRAVRIPSRVDADIFENAVTVPGPPQVTAVVEGNDDFAAERLIAYELGYRGHLVRGLALDADLFYNDYKRIRALLPLPLGVRDGRLVLPFAIVNDATAASYGGTLAATWQTTRRMRLRASYTYLHSTIEPEASTPNALPDFIAQLNPRHQAALRSSFSLPAGVDLDLALRYVSALNAPVIPAIPDYLQGDARVAWPVRPGLTMALVGQDLLAPRHAEFRPGPFEAERRAIERRVRLDLEWRF